MIETESPFVSVIVPVRNDARHLAEAVEAAQEQDYEGRIEVVLSVGPSDDSSELLAEELAQRSGVRVVLNPEGTTAHGLNRAIAASQGDVVVRVDAHCVLQPDYVGTAVRLLRETGAWNVGGIQRAEGRCPMQRAIAAAMTSRYGTGDAHFHYGGTAGPTDTVYLGVWPRQVLSDIGGFDETLLRNQDYELNIRIREAGGVVWFDPSLVTRYRPRASLSGLASQYWQYGGWKRVVLRRHPGSLRWRQAVPPAAVVALGLSILMVPVTQWALIVPCIYAIGTAVASIVVARGDLGLQVRLPAVFATMHLAWGAGFLVGARGRLSRSR